MAVLGGDGADQKHKLAGGGGGDQKQKPAANGSLLESFEVETFYWPPSSPPPPPPSTRQMLGNNGDHHQQQHNGRDDDSSSGRRGRRRRRSFAVPLKQEEEEEEEEGGQQEPEWVGGVFDIWDDISLAYLSVFCSCCVFGWNAGRLGFGNMYVHVVTFVLLCLAPFFIFNLAAVNIDNENVRDALGMGGVLLCVLGLLYGGFWRIQMRRRFRLPGNHACCGNPDLADCLQWLCCYSCSLAQEVRTADAYDVVQDRLHPYRRNEDDDDSSSSPSSHYIPIDGFCSANEQVLGD
ncbi:hypothetical protein PR202_gb16663 [Eleusine coracana subsp. coracana]|uniref:Uncharacterized protein n=1 Tax=Eleusine coracana subsp. coracana TaxID=191504 RepID=A0AAV5EYP6_ELECO|nr:hypothetical protein PR202_gb16663 [Eleusine coracana subsp. coracana]